MTTDQSMPTPAYGNEDEFLKRLRCVATMPDLDAMRAETVHHCMAGGSKEHFERIQAEFRRALNRLKRVPLAERTW